MRRPRGWVLGETISALFLQARGADWVLPLNEAGGISQIITRRAAAANRTL